MKSEQPLPRVHSPIYPTAEVAAAPAVVSTSKIDGMGTATVGATDARRQVLLFMGFLAAVEPFELQRFALLAASWDAQVTVVDVPGCGYGGARLRRAERRALRRGDFMAVAYRMVNAALVQNPRLAAGPIAVVGYSLGASLAAAATTSRRLNIDIAVLVEPVATHRWRVPTLIRATRREDEVLDEYLDRNAGFSAAVLPVERRGDPPPHQSRIDLAHLGFALSRGRIASDLERGYARDGFALEVVHGVRSQLSRCSDVEHLIERVRSAGIEVHDVPVAGRHALWHSLPDVARLARLTLQRWPKR